MSFACAGTDNYDNMTVIAITACGLGVLCNVDKIQTGILPYNYSLFTLKHTSSGTVVAWGILLGQIFGGAGGQHILWEVRPLSRSRHESSPLYPNTFVPRFAHKSQVGLFIFAVGRRADNTVTSMVCLYLFILDAVFFCICARTALFHNLKTQRLTHTSWWLWFLATWIWFNTFVPPNFFTSMYFHPVASYVQVVDRESWFVVKYKIPGWKEGGAAGDEGVSLDFYSWPSKA